jgi:hypothetical protein
MIINKNLKFSQPLIPIELNRITKIIIHHTGTTTPQSVDEIHRYHQSKGWNGIGYTEYIRRDGIRYTGRGLNIGAHCHGHNSSSIGICFEGDFKVQTLEPLQIIAGFISILEYKRLMQNQNLVTFRNGDYENCVVTIQHDLRKNEIENLAVVRHDSLDASTSCPGMLDISLLQQQSYENVLNLIYEILQINKIITSPEYWKQNAIFSKNCNGEYVLDLMQNIYRYILAQAHKK